MKARCRSLSAAVLTIVSLVALARADSLADRLQSLLAEKGPAAGAYGLVVMDPANGDVFFEADAEVPREPASVMKLVTSAAAFIGLKGDYEFGTRALAGAEPKKNGDLDGDLVVVGGGDPSLDVAGEDGSGGGIDKLARAIAAAGVRRIAGDIVLDDGFFGGHDRPKSWPQDQLTRDYCAAPSALSVHRNVITVVVAPGAKIGDPAKVRLIPDTDAVTVENDATTTGSRKEHKIIVGIRADGVLFVKGKVWIRSHGYPADVAAPDPTAVFGDALRNALVRHGVALSGKIVERPGAGGKLASAVLLASVKTPLTDVLAKMDEESINVYAECVLRTIGATLAHDGSYAASTAEVSRLLARFGVDPKSLVQLDGSGLSHSDRVTPLFVAKVLCGMYRGPNRIRYLECLATGGEAKSTLSRRLSDLGSDVRLKTGTIDGVSCLAGYVRTVKKHILCFAFMIDDRRMHLSAARSVQDQVCRILHEEK